MRRILVGIGKTEERKLKPPIGLVMRKIKKTHLTVITESFKVQLISRRTCERPIIFVQMKSY